MFIDNFVDKINNYSIAVKCTIQIFHVDKPEWENSIPEPIGSGVLLEIERSCYIITASHVIIKYAKKEPSNPYNEEDIYDNPSDCYLTLNNVGFVHNFLFYPIRSLCFVELEELGDCIDLAIIRLDSRTASELKSQYTFLTIDNILLNKKIEENDCCIIYGYPSIWVDVNYNSIKSRSFIFQTHIVPPKLITNAKHNPQYNILLSYNKKDICSKNNKVTLENFSPNGISGCGLWLYEENKLKLIGIMTEDKSSKEQLPLMMATKIDEVISIIESVKIPQ